MKPNEVINKLKHEGYIARQSQSSQSFFLNLGGPQSVIHRSDFKGMILLNEEVIFGTRKISKIMEFRDNLMDKIDGKWKKRENVPPVTGNNDRVDVRLLDNAATNFEENAKVTCRVGGELINLYGYKESIPFHNNQYEWNDIENFLQTLDKAEFNTKIKWLDADEAELPSLEQSSSYSLLEDDRRLRVERQICERRGQVPFRNSLRKRYGDRCLVTDCRVLAVLEAAHISPYRGEEDNHCDNGLLLRADIHTLFDLNLLGIEPGTLQIELHTQIATDYASLAGKHIDCRDAKPPSSEALTLMQSQILDSHF